MSSGERDESSDPRDENLGFAQTVTPPGGTPAVADVTLPSEIAERPEADKLQRAVAKNRVGAKLFSKKAEAVKLGRYHLLETVGAGGMGVVWGAWDPELDRRVAIKLVKAEMLAARERILLEGQALAKLSHPNVVPVYDVGVVDEQVYLVMEWVRGKNLRAYCKEPRSIRDVVHVYRAAGEGLSAAHRVGLIHRDFKPDNAMIGDDGRVRVLDFGLARGEVKAKPKSEDGVDESSDLTRGAGTPRYMPPEQAEGDELTPAVDQYALGVSLREALVGRNADGKDADVPRWLDEVIDRATARAATNRYESMDVLLHALGRDPARVWRRRGIVAGVLVLAGATFVIGSVQAGGDTVEKCGGGTEEIAKAWNPNGIAAHLGSLGAYGAEEAKRLVPEMTKYGAGWAATHQRVCQANERAELSPQLYDARLACLSRAQASLQTVAEILGRSTAENLPDAIVASRALPDVDRCAMQTSSNVESPPAAIKADVDRLSTAVSRVRLLALANDPAAKTEAGQIAERADQIGYLPLVGRARLAYGFALIGDGSGAADAIPHLEKALSASLRAGDLVTFIETYAREAYVHLLTNGTKLNIGATSRIVEELAAGTKTDGAFARALLLNNLGLERMASGDLPAARVYFERAAAEPQVGKRDFELNIIVGNLAMVTEDPDRRHELIAAERATFERELGVNHPLTIASNMRTASSVVDHPTEAAAVLRDARDRLVKWHPHARAMIEQCQFELGWLAAERGDLAEMRAAMSDVQLAPLSAPIARAYVQLADGDVARASREMTAYGEELAANESWFFRTTGVDAFLVAATAFEKLRQPARAISLLERSLVVLEDKSINKSSSYLARRIARVRARLALLIATTKPETAKRLATEALIWYRKAGGYAEAIAALEPLAR